MTADTPERDLPDPPEEVLVGVLCEECSRDLWAFIIGPDGLPDFGRVHSEDHRFVYKGQPLNTLTGR